MWKRLLGWLDAHRLTKILLFVAIFTMAVRAPMDSDTWWHLQAGRVTLEQGRSLQTDVFSHTRYGSGWVNHSWLSQVILYWLFRHLSYAGLALALALLVTATFALVYWQMEGSPIARAFALVLAATTSAVVWSARPQLFSLLLTAVVAYVLHLLKWKGMHRLWILPPLFALWVNLHAGYALGLMVLVAFVAGEIFNHLLQPHMPADDPVVGWRGIGTVVSVTLASALFLVLNPNTTRMWTYYLETVRIEILPELIQEWRSPDFHPLHTQPFIWMLLTTLAAMGLSNRRVDGTDLALVGVFAYAGLLAARHIGPFAVVAAPVLSRHVASIGCDLWGQKSGVGRHLDPSRATINGALLALVLVLAAVRVQQPLRPAYNEALQRERLPVHAVSWVEEQRPQGEMFNHYDWGGYLIWRLWPAYRVFVDGRTDLYGNGFLRDYVTVHTARSRFDNVLLAHDVDWVIIPTGGTLSNQLACRAAWSQVYRDDVAVIWTREPE